MNLAIQLVMKACPGPKGSIPEKELRLQNRPAAIDGEKCAVALIL
jgi:hypothetical protein